MKASEFVKKFGWFITTRLVKKVDTTNNPHFPILLEDLKRLVESHELVECMGGLDEAKYILKMAELNGHKYEKTQKAIADVESCQ